MVLGPKGSPESLNGSDWFLWYMMSALLLGDEDVVVRPRPKPLDEVCRDSRGKGGE